MNRKPAEAVIQLVPANLDLLVREGVVAPGDAERTLGVLEPAGTSSGPSQFSAYPITRASAWAQGAR